MSVKIEVSFGELVDKITILEIKSQRIDDEEKLTNIRRELDTLNSSWAGCGADPDLVTGERDELKAINEQLWDIEDRIRAKEADKSFDEDFVALARSVYQTNDDRSRVKRRINELLGSVLIEEKSYKPY